MLGSSRRRSEPLTRDKGISRQGDNLMTDSYRVLPATGPLRGRVSVPGDKSISHRAVLLASLASGRSEISGLNSGDDVRSTCRIVTQLGARLRRGPADELEIEGCGWEALRVTPEDLDAGNSATTMRLVLGVCAASPGHRRLTGDDSLLRRPMLRVVEPLRAMGATIDGPSGGDRAPLSVKGGDLTAIRWTGAVASAQVKSAILLAALRANGTTTYSEPAPTRDHTERMLASAGVTLDRYGSTVRVAGGQAIAPGPRRVPGDVSAAMFVAVAAAIVPGSDVTIERVGLNPTRTRALDVLRRMGADVTTEVRGSAGGEPFGDVRVKAEALDATDIAAVEIPALVDEIPALAVAASRAHGTTVVSAAGELRNKESDRIRTIVEGLRSVGVAADPFDEGLSVTGCEGWRGGRVSSHGDHRIALAFAAGGLAAEDAVEIEGWSSAAVSFPGWKETIARVGGGG
jgi:3-phosphoshikimate 1-carboxyvinyltransferase